MMRWKLGTLIAGAFLSPCAICACSGAPQTIVAGVEDNFRGPPKRTTPSARLAAIETVKQYPPGRLRRFDEDDDDRLFITSLRLPARKICSAQFEIRVRRRSKGGLSYEFNDFLLIGFAPFGTSGDRKGLFRAAIWAGDPPDVLAKTARIPLPAVELNRFVLLTPGPHYLDIMLHDDTTVDYVKLILRYE
jgi:hypothetical protein